MWPRREDPVVLSGERKPEARYITGAFEAKVVGTQRYAIYKVSLSRVGFK